MEWIVRLWILHTKQAYSYFAPPVWVQSQKWNGKLCPSQGWGWGQQNLWGITLALQSSVYYLVHSFGRNICLLFYSEGFFWVVECFKTALHWSKDTRIASIKIMFRGKWQKTCVKDRTLQQPTVSYGCQEIAKNTFFVQNIIIVVSQMNWKGMAVASHNVCCLSSWEFYSSKEKEKALVWK